MRAPSGRWDDLLILCSSKHWDEIAMAEKHLALRLADHAPVLFVDPPASPLRGGRITPRLDAVQPGIVVLRTPGLPGPNRWGVRTLLRQLMMLVTRRAVHAMGSPTVRAIVSVRLPDLYDACPALHRVALVTDDFAAGAALMGVDETFLLDAEREQAKRSDIVLTVSENLAEKFRALTDADVRVVPNGVDVELYSDVDSLHRPTDITLGGPMAVCMGHFNARLDPKLLDELADREIPLLLIGPRSNSLDEAWFDRLVARPSVQWVGPKASHELPGYLGAVEVGLVPYVLSEFNQASFPLKTLEYLAAGRAVVTSPLEAARFLDSPLVVMADGPAEFADRVEEELSRPRTPELVAARRALADRHSWKARAATVAEAVGLPIDSKDPG